LFVGNKTDLRNEDDEDEQHVKTEIARKVIEKMGCKYMECSALT